MSSNADSDPLTPLLETHDIGRITPCTLKDNRSTIPDPTDPNKDLFCWTGIIEQQDQAGQPTCIIGTVCSPYSYTEARTAFCLSWKHPTDPPDMCYPAALVSTQGTKYQGQDVLNSRGGIVVDTGKCKDANDLTSKLNCIVGGLQQSFQHALKSPLTMVVSLFALIFLVWGGRFLYHNYIKKEVKKV